MERCRDAVGLADAMLKLHVASKSSGKDDANLTNLLATAAAERPEAMGAVRSPADAAGWKR
jgi:hypothetical protein